MDIVTLQDSETSLDKIKSYKQVVELFELEYKWLKELHAEISYQVDSIKSLYSELDTVEKEKYIRNNIELVGINKRLLGIESEIAAKKEFIKKYEEKLEQDKIVYNEWLEKAKNDFSNVVRNTEAHIIKAKSISFDETISPTFQKMANFYNLCKENNFGFADNESMVKAYKTLLNNLNDYAK
jgi:phage-related protein